MDKRAVDKAVKAWLGKEPKALDMIKALPLDEQRAALDRLEPKNRPRL